VSGEVLRHAQDRLRREDEIRKELNAWENIFLAIGNRPSGNCFLRRGAAADKKNPADRDAYGVVCFKPEEST
jgi:hypothetical protein